MRECRVVRYPLQIKMPASLHGTLFVVLKLYFVDYNALTLELDTEHIYITCIIGGILVLLI
jgi:hypothetical protein